MQRPKPVLVQNSYFLLVVFIFRKHDIYDNLSASFRFKSNNDDSEAHKSNANHE